MNKVIWEITPWNTLWSMSNGAGSPMHSEIAKGMSSSCFKVIEITPKTSGVSLNSRITKIVIIGVALSQVLQLMDYIIYTVSALALAKNRDKPNLIYSYGYQGALAVWILSHIYRVGSITRLFGTFIPPQCSFMELLLRWQEVLAYKIPCSYLIITDDGTQGDKVSKRLNVPSNRLIYWKNGVDEYNGSITPHNGIIIFTASRLVKWKRLDRLIKSLPKVLEICPDVTVIIAGEGEDRKYLENISNGLPVKFIGAIPHNKALEYMVQSDVFVSVNDISNLSNGLYEAMAAGRCVVTLNNGATGEVIKNEVNGILIKAEKEDDIITDLSDYLIRVINSRELREYLGRNAKRYIQSNFLTWDKRVEMEVELIKELCK